MARQKFEKSFNTFVKGLMTEASEINFPENYSLYEKNFELRRDGGRDRRRGMELVYPLGVVMTSRPYRLNSIEMARVGAGSAAEVYDNRQVVNGSGGIETASLGAEASGLVLRSLLYDMEAAPESAHTNVALSGISLNKVSVSASVSEGDAEVGASVSRINLRVAAVNQSLETESTSTLVSVSGVFFDEI